MSLSALVFPEMLSSKVDILDKSNDLTQEVVFVVLVVVFFFPVLNLT